ncbi:hypothetical protein EJC49_03175 [Aquibium carbonis]|uniref:Uncharacterized protein n=1 Tax=Aquibium carbonis TaxID=2495581 RepID=A0A3R9YHJ9_9HYPH|nr:hypothetical protein [Aquibium carbonis]RST87899.1 hypothetical protein EJC49_03175 [Aquibium carbonis]
MKMIIAAAALVAALNGSALADGKVDRSMDPVEQVAPLDQADRSIDQIDRSIDQAAARILAGRIGDIRGGFAPGQKPAFIRTVSAETTASTKRQDPAPVRRVSRSDGPWIDGLARARDPLAGRAIVGL